MNIRTISAGAAVALIAMTGIASADALSVSCAGSPTLSSITWTATPVGGIGPIALLWGNGATTSSQTLSYSPGLYSIGIQATDASSTVATSTCSATVVQSAPSITTFTASPSSITSGQNSLLSWTVVNASSTSIDHDVGTVTGTSVLVVPAVTTTYTLSAVNPAGTSTATVTVTVATSTSDNSSLQERIKALLEQIAGLQKQLAALLANRGGSATSTPPHIPPGQVGKAACIVLTRSLHLGDKGDDVMSIQQMLADDPDTGFNVLPTGFFGPLTMKAMIKFQLKNAIASSSAADGSVGPLTRGFFERHCGKGLTKNAPEWSDSASSTASSTARDGIRPLSPGKSGEDHGWSDRNNKSDKHDD